MPSCPKLLIFRNRQAFFKLQATTANISVRSRWLFPALRLGYASYTLFCKSKNTIPRLLGHTIMSLHIMTSILDYVN
jgi:hypothetical protein